MMYKTKKYILLNLLCSWGLFATVLIIAFVSGNQSLLNGHSTILDIVTIIYCWMPNIVLILIFSKLGLNKTIKQFYQEQLSEKVNGIILLRILILQIAVCLLSACIVSIIDQSAIMDLFAKPEGGILSSAFFCLFTGATGEESGWRGFLLQGFWQRHTLLKSSVYTGLAWAIWHLPVWLLSGYQGINLLIYIVAFFVSLIMFTIVMMYYYEKNHNIAVLVFFHYMINFVLSFYIGNDLLYQTVSALLYTVTAAYIISRNRELYLSVKNNKINC